MMGATFTSSSCHSSYSGLNIHGHSVVKPSMDTPRYKLTPERAIPLIKWFEEHKKHPYPTRHEKMVLCQSTQLTYTQVCRVAVYNSVCNCCIASEVERLFQDIIIMPEP